MCIRDRVRTPLRFPRNETRLKRGCCYGRYPRHRRRNSGIRLCPAREEQRKEEKEFKGRCEKSRRTGSRSRGSVSAGIFRNPPCIRPCAGGGAAPCANKDEAGRRDACPGSRGKGIRTCLLYTSTSVVGMDPLSPAPPQREAAASCALRASSSPCTRRVTS